jgi:hypothetical protein
MPRRKKGLVIKKREEKTVATEASKEEGPEFHLVAGEEEEEEKDEPVSVEELAEWTRLMRLNTETRRQVEFEKRFEDNLRKQIPDFDKLIEETRERKGLQRIMHEWDRRKFEREQNETGYRPPQKLRDGTYVQKRSKMKFMVVVFGYESYRTCDETPCTKTVTHGAFVVADIARNREKVAKGVFPQNWTQPPGYPGAEDLRRSPETLRSQIIYLCPRHRHNSWVRNCFIRFRNDKELKRVVESPVRFYS